jgi:hypothetical protein
LEGDRVRRRRRRRVEAALAAAAVAGIAIVALVLNPLSAPRTELPHPTLRVRLGLDPLPRENLIISAAQRGEVAAQRVPLESERVVFYLVASRRSFKPTDGRATSEEPTE